MSDQTRPPLDAGRSWILGVFLVTLVVYGLAATRVLTYAEPPTGDQPHFLMTVISIVDDHDLDESNNYTVSASYNQFYPIKVLEVRPDDRQVVLGYPPGFKGMRVGYPLSGPPTFHATPMKNRPETEWYSTHGPGLPPLIVPGWVIGKALTPFLKDLTANGGGGWPGTVFVLNLFGALLATQVFLLAWETTGHLVIALAVWAALSFSNPQMSYSMLIWPEVPAALLAIYAFRRLNRGWADNSRWQLGLVGICLGYLPWLHFRYLFIPRALATFAIYQAWRAWAGSGVASPHSEHGPLDRAAADCYMRLASFFGPFLLLGLLLAGYYYWLTGTPLPNPVVSGGTFVPSVDGQSATPEWDALMLAALGLFLDQQWGLLTYAPVLILTIVGVVSLWRAPTRRATLRWLALVILAYLFAVADFRAWWGSWSPPGSLHCGDHTTACHAPGPVAVLLAAEQALHSPFRRAGRVGPAHDGRSPERTGGSGPRPVTGLLQPSDGKGCRLPVA